MTEYEINDLIAELKTSNTFSEFTSLGSLIVRNVDSNGKSMNATPEAISVATKLYNALKDKSLTERSKVLTTIICSVLPNQANSLWESFLSNPDLKRFAMSLENDSEFVTAFRKVYGF